MFSETVCVIFGPVFNKETIMSIRKVLAGAFIAGLLQLVLIGSAAADLTTGAYVGLEGGLAWTANLTYTTSNGGCYYPYYCTYPTYYNAVTYNLGYSAGAMVGYSFGGPRVEFEYNYRNNGVNTVATQAGTQSGSGDLTSNNYMVNVLYDFDTGSQWVPYVGLGLGMADISANNIHSSDLSKPGNYLTGSSNKFAAQFIVGAEYQVNEKFGVTIDWRGLWANNATFNYGVACNAGGTGGGCGQTGAFSYNYWNGAINLGIRYKF
jgi:opacity protein-like surface antigen